MRGINDDRKNAVSPVDLRAVFLEFSSSAEERGANTGSTLKKKSPGRNSIALRFSEATPEYSSTSPYAVHFNCLYLTFLAFR
ncbi:hypothetical protein ANN_05131 [Periplaneta americana]|uniref:Uncharacterized protein n=1 Tax=Periplaneta americana TaxID=6978 RepID=A0ABQ8TCD1_PERAM|nr:hypothetical protein ANN_05131 [Periplaneta americana]